MTENRFLASAQLIRPGGSDRFSTRRGQNVSRAKGQGNPQVSEAAVGSDQFTLDVLEFFFDERLTPGQLNDCLRQVAADALWRATQGSRAMDLVPRPTGGRPGPLWLVGQAVQIAFRRAQNQGIYEAVRVTVKAAMRTDYQLGKVTCEEGGSRGITQSLSVNNYSVSDTLVAFIKNREGFRGNLYNDPVGHCTIGYGHLVHSGNCNGSEPESYRQGLSEAQATELLRADLNRTGAVVNGMVTVALNQAQFDALTSFAFNIGPGALRQSTLLRRLNQGEFAAVPEELRRWVNASGRRLEGLVRRREEEAQMFSQGSYAGAQSLRRPSFISRPFSTNQRIYYDVYLTPQPDKLSCWAASMAMIVGFRRQVSIPPETLAQEVGRSLRTSYSWDMLEAVKNHFGFIDISLPNNASFYVSPQEWYNWLQQYGPLWVTVQGAPSHAIVVHGIEGDLTPTGTTIHILNPWNRNQRFDGDQIDFNPPNTGSQYSQPFNVFTDDFGNLGLSEYGRWRVLYKPEGY